MTGKGQTGLRLFVTGCHNMVRGYFCIDICAIRVVGQMYVIFLFICTLYSFITNYNLTLRLKQRFKIFALVNYKVDVNYTPNQFLVSHFDIIKFNIINKRQILQ